MGDSDTKTDGEIAAFMLVTYDRLLQQIRRDYSSNQ